MYNPQETSYQTTMKKLMILMLLASLTTAISAQEVYAEIKAMAQKKVDDPHTAAVVKDINRFQIDALNYMGMKMKEEIPDSSAAYLDNQAYALYNYVNMYLKTLRMRKNDPQKTQLANIKLFIDASTSSPLFGDKADKEYVMSYFNNPDSPIRFSLDTNWIKAYVLVAESLKK